MALSSELSMDEQIHEDSKLLAYCVHALGKSERESILARYVENRDYFASQEGATMEKHASHAQSVLSHVFHVLAGGYTEKA